MIKKVIPVLVLLVTSLLGLKALFLGPLYSAHDIWHNIARFHHYFQALQDGQFPPYWVANMTYNHGYPLFFFSYPLPWMIGSLLLIFGLSLPIAFKLLVFLAFFASGYFMYLLLRKITNDEAASITSGVLYLVAPYHFLTVFVSSAVGTLFIFVFLPLLLLGIYLLINNQRKSGKLLTTVAAAGMLLSHLLTIIFLLPVIIVLLFGFIKNKSKVNYRSLVGNFLLVGILIFLITAFYLVPAIFYSKDTAISDIGGFSDLHKNNFVYFSQLLYSKWGSGPITTYARDGEISFQVGIAQWVSIAGLLILALVLKKNRALNISVVLGFGVVIFLMLEQSAIIWNLIVKVIALDYPFRGLLPAVFLSSLAAGLMLVLVNRKWLKISIAVFLIATAFYTNRNHTKVIMYVDNSYMDFVASEVTTNTFNEYRPTGSSLLFRAKERPLVSENAKLLNTSQNSYQTIWEIEATQSSKISVSQLAFPGQVLYLDNKRTNYTADSYGRINFDVNEGIHFMKVVFEPTLIIQISKLLSIIGLLSVVMIMIRKEKLR